MNGDREEISAGWEDEEGEVGDEEARGTESSPVQTV